MSDVLKRAKALQKEIEASIGGNSPNVYDCMASEYLPELIAEVERMRSASTHELDLRNRHIECLEARITELEADIKRLRQQIIPRDPTEAQKHALKCQNSMNVWNQRYDQAQEVIKGQDARIKELETDVERLKEALRKRPENLGRKLAARDKEIKRLSGALKAYSLSVGWMLSKQDDQIKELKATLVDSRAEYLLFLRDNPSCNAWNFDELSEEDQNTLREQARISLKMEEPLALIQLREARARIKELDAEAQEYHDKKEAVLTLYSAQNRYVERLEAAFLEAKRCPTCNGKGFIRDPYLSRVRGLIIDESIDRICPMCEGKGEENARDALERIKEEKG